MNVLVRGSSGGPGQEPARVLLPGKRVSALRQGQATTPKRCDGRVTWEQWLARQAALRP